MNRRLYKSPTERVISGVAGGVAEYFDADPAIVRVIWALLAIITGGVFLVIYIVMWIVVPEPQVSVMPPEGSPGVDPATGQPGPASPSTWNAQPARRHRHGSGAGSWVFGLFLIGLGGYLLAREYLTWFDVDRLWPLALVAVGVMLIVVAMRRRPS